MSTDASFNSAFRAETTSLYAVGLVFILVRLGARLKKFGFMGLQPDDWFMTQNILWYTLLYVSLNKVIFGGGSNFMTEEDIAALTPETTAMRIAGSKWVLVSEESMGCFNVSADLALLIVGLPLLFKTRIPVQQKMILLIIFGMGMFVIAAALLCKVYGLYAPLITYSYLNWFFREASVSVYVTNIPVIYSFLREVFPSLAKWGFNTSKGSATRSNGNQRHTRPNNKDIGMKPFNRLGSTTDDMDDSLKTQSQEHIIQYKEPSGYKEYKDPYSADPGQLKIHKDVTFSVQKTSSDDDELEAGNMPLHDPSHNHSTTYVTAR
ncbi:MAG: hypothetical protein L6R38_008895 [Xanthoria sp. 2 TBL-2021]|nr:MAG: hypothetical protein L6R38_008895 [Xanthoria sp. 2 TBL-2021]